LSDSLHAKNLMGFTETTTTITNVRDVAGGM